MSSAAELEDVLTLALEQAAEAAAEGDDARSVHLIETAGHALAAVYVNAPMWCPTPEGDAAALLEALVREGFRVIRPDPDRVNTDPVVVSCAVRYALGRLSYLPGMIADEVRRCWPHLGHQRDVITKDITEWLAEPWRHDQRPGFEDTVTVWSDLAAWIDRQADTDTGRTDE